MSKYVVRTENTSFIQGCLSFFMRKNRVKVCKRRKKEGGGIGMLMAIEFFKIFVDFFG